MSAQDPEVQASFLRMRTLVGSLRAQLAAVREAPVAIAEVVEVLKCGPHCMRGKMEQHCDRCHEEFDFVMTDRPGHGLGAVR